MIQLEFLGANDTVTGSRTILTYRGRRWLIDCGLFQGDKAKRERNWAPIGPELLGLSGVILTHAHLDHCGYLPRLCKKSFSGRVHATHGTVDLVEILLRDAAHLEEEAAAFANETQYSNHRPAEPLFTEEDAERAIRLLVGHPRDHWIPLAEGLMLRFVRAGHIVGASFVQLSVDTGDGTKVLTFSGDLGNDRSLILRGPEFIHSTDVLVVEGTYGDKLQPRVDALAAFSDVANRTFARGGALVVPAFAVGRAQEVTYMVRLLQEKGLIPQVPVILDSPMAASAMRIALNHPEDLVVSSGFSGSSYAFHPRNFEVAQTPDESMLACMRDGPLIVISASGMLNGGRILHHLKARLPDSRNTVLFTGYQADGTKGRFLQENAGKVETLRIHHQPVELQAEVVTLDCLSSHADWKDTLGWLEHVRMPPQRIFINHGEPAAQDALAARILEHLGWEAEPVNRIKDGKILLKL